MSLSDQNRAIFERVSDVAQRLDVEPLFDATANYPQASSVDRKRAFVHDLRSVLAARAEGPEPQTIPLGAKQAAIEALEPFAIALEHFKDPRPYLLLESFHRAAEALAMLRAEGRLSPEEVLADQNAVHINMLRGGIAKPSPAQIGHLYRGDEAAEVVREVIRQNPEAALSTPSPETASCFECGGTDFADRVCLGCNDIVDRAPAPSPEGLEPQVFAWLSRKYVQRADDRQKSMGLQYTTAETHDLARQIAGFVATLSPPAPEPGYEAEPVAWRAQDEDGKWLSSCTYENAVELARCFGTTVQPLYASPVPVAISREELEQEISEAVLSASVEVPDDFGDRVAMRRTITKNTADAILQRLSNQQGGDR